MVCTAGAVGAVGAVGAAEARPVHLFPPPLGSRLLQVRTEVAESAGSVGAVGAVGGAAAEAGVAAVAAARVTLNIVDHLARTRPECQGLRHAAGKDGFQIDARWKRA